MKLRILVINFLLIICNNINAQNWEETEKVFLDNLGTSQIEIAKNELTKLEKLTKQQFKDTSFQTCKLNYYKGLIEFLDGNYEESINNFLLSKKYYVEASKKECGFYHAILQYLSGSYRENREYQKAYDVSFELITLENRCRYLGNYEYTLAIKNYALTCLELPMHWETGATTLLNIISINEGVILKIDGNPEYKDHQLELILDNINNIGLISNLYYKNGEIKKSLYVRDDLEKYKKYINLSPSIENKLIGECLNNATKEQILNFTNKQIELIEKGNLYVRNSVEYFYNLGSLYFRIGSYEQSAKYYELAIKKYIEDRRNDEDFLASLYKCLSLSYMDLYKYDQSIIAVKAGIDILLKSKDKFKAEVAGLEIYLAELYFRNHQYEQSGKICDDLLSNKYLLKEDKRMLLRTKINILFAQKKYNDCIPYIEKYMEYSLDKATELFAYGSEMEKINNESLLRFSLEEHLDILRDAYSKNQAASILSYNSCLFIKSALLESDRKLTNSILLYKNSNDLALLTELNSIKNEQLKSILKNDKTKQKYFGVKIDSINKILSRKYANISSTSKVINYSDVVNSLNKNECAVEFIKFYDSKDSTDKYMVLLIRADAKSPTLINLCKEEELKQYSPELELNETYDLVWKPLLPYLEGIKTVYYSPSGLLNNIPFQALYKEVNGQREYVMDKFTLHQLTSTRYLALDLKKKEQEPIDNSIALFGGINYNDYPNAVIDTSTIDESTEAAFLYKNTLTLNRDLDSTRAGASYLPGTKREVITIAQLLKNNNWNVDMAEGKNASENKLKSLSGNNSKSILHIATHGFAYPDKKEKRKDNVLTMMQGNDRYRAADNPMIRSGLLFGGANLTWKGKGDSLLNKTNEDGVLTAYELSQLDLSNTKLAVLSACETGKGAIQGSEGTFGLKRALKLAGVDNMIVSLWKVPDDATMEMMTLFYTELAKSKKTVSSFESAQRAMRLKYPKEPKKWAGFVFVR